MEAVTISYDKTIKSHFPADQEVLICLFPFNHQVFADHFNWEADLKNTYPLLAPKSWKEISDDIGFNSLNRLAKGILELQDPFQSELKEYCGWNKIEFPDYVSDKIPAGLLIPLIRYFKSKGLTDLRTKKLERFPDSKNKIVTFKNKNEFDIYLEIEEAKSLKSKDGIEILLPDYDCPYALMIGSKRTCLDVVKACDIEYIETNNHTRFDWWNQD